MNPEFTTNVQKWVALDNELKGAQETVKQIRDRRNQLGETILDVVDTSNLGNATVKISDGKLRFVGLSCTTRNLEASRGMPKQVHPKSRERAKDYAVYQGLKRGLCHKRY